MKYCIYCGTQLPEGGKSIFVYYALQGFLEGLFGLG